MDCNVRCILQATWPIAAALQHGIPSTPTKYAYAMQQVLYANAFVCDKMIGQTITTGQPGRPSHGCARHSRMHEHRFVATGFYISFLHRNQHALLWSKLNHLENKYMVKIPADHPNSDLLRSVCSTSNLHCVPDVYSFLPKIALCFSSDQHPAMPHLA